MCGCPRIASPPGSARLGVPASPTRHRSAGVEDAGAAGADGDVFVGAGGGELAGGGAGEGPVAFVDEAVMGSAEQGEFSIDRTCDAVWREGTRVPSQCTRTHGLRPPQLGRQRFVHGSPQTAADAATPATSFRLDTTAPRLHGSHYSRRGSWWAVPAVQRQPVAGQERWCMFAADVTFHGGRLVRRARGVAVAARRCRAEYRYSRPVQPGPCPDHEHCTVIRCHHVECRRLMHVPLLRRGQPRRFCSTRCRVAEHRRLA